VEAKVPFTTLSNAATLTGKECNRHTFHLPLQGADAGGRAIAARAAGTWQALVFSGKFWR
jgi:hypothetical protein